jgi:phosphotransacetylase
MSHVFVMEAPDYLGDSQSAGIALGGRVPIALASRADTALERVASCALAVLVAHTPMWRKATCVKRVRAAA